VQRLDCGTRGTCLRIAAGRGWLGFTCEGCGAYERQTREAHVLKDDPIGLGRIEGALVVAGDGVEAQHAQAVFFDDEDPLVWAPLIEQHLSGLGLGGFFRHGCCAHGSTTRRDK
jgi:hypothetical protein